MTAAPAVTETHLDGLRLVHRGKVRDVYEVGEALLIVATDRVSAYDSVLTPGIPEKGRILTSMSAFWFDVLADVVPNHVLTTDVDAMPPSVRRHADVLRGRSMLCRRLTMFPVECVVRGYLTGSGWKDYKRTGMVSGHRLPAGLLECGKLTPPLYTPSTKAAVGHDETIDFAQTERIVGAEAAARLRDLTLAVFRRATEVAEARGILLADTKLEFGRDASGTIVLGDEVLTPDSSRFWDARRYAPGRGQDSYDKQRIRDWLDRAGWDHNPPPPPLPADVVATTTATYREIHRRLTGKDV
ncbi:MAG: phosphoribosylaminoimidazolesuccinocarboxamide synthase [Planctomycetes bacterium]|nr:phosphoribosylaminoimidazolesuccinocarboxamide synthase [Planctomycetota bacterium]